jgi:diguanylate cyclase (GGDEF)-like protein
LTIGGEIVGSVLVSRARPLDSDDERCVRDSILCAAPVFANLRNLAVAEARAATDSLTGLANKRSIETTFRQMVAQARRTSTMLAVLAADLDHFKAVNDTFGHERGDAVLSPVGAALRSALRASDVAGRNGGEEFLVLLPATDSAAALAVAEKIRAEVASLQVPGVEGALSLSIGVAVYPLHSGDADTVLRAADRALYQAKSGGRNRVEAAAVPEPPLQPAATDHPDGWPARSA